MKLLRLMPPAPCSRRFVDASWSRFRVRGIFPTWSAPSRSPRRYLNSGQRTNGPDLAFGLLTRRGGDLMVGPKRDIAVRSTNSDVAKNGTPMQERAEEELLRAKEFHDVVMAN